MKLYVSHSTKFDYQSELYAPLQQAFGEHDLFFPHKGGDAEIKTKDIIGSCDYVLAEVSLPSTGQGIELGWANGMNVPIICLHKPGTTPSSALRFITGSFIEYSSIEDLISKLKQELKTNG